MTESRVIQGRPGAKGRSVSGAPDDAVHLCGQQACEAVVGHHAARPLLAEAVAFRTEHRPGAWARYGETVAVQTTLLTRRCPQIPALHRVGARHHDVHGSGSQTVRGEAPAQMSTCDFNHILAEFLRHNLAVPSRPASLSAPMPVSVFTHNLAGSAPARA